MNYQFYLKNFNAFAAKEATATWIREKMNKFGLDSKCIVELDNSVESLAATALCIEAIGPERIIGVILADSLEYDIVTPSTFARNLNIQYYLVNIENSYQIAYNEIAAATNQDVNIKKLYNHIGSLMLQTIADNVGNGHVVNITNLTQRYSEEIEAYGDLAPLHNFLNDEIKLIFKTFNLSYPYTERSYKIPVKIINLYAKELEVPRGDYKLLMDEMVLKNKIKTAALDYYYFFPLTFQKNI